MKHLTHKKIQLLSLLKFVFIFSLALSLWFITPPDGLKNHPHAWPLFVLFFTTIISVLMGAIPILLASIVALFIALLTQTLTIEQALSGFQQDFIFLILAAFFLAQAVVSSGLGARFAFRLVDMFGKSSLGLGYSLFMADLLIAPVFASNTARSALLHPLCLSLSIENKSLNNTASRHYLGSYLMMNTMAGLSISSALWLTAMAANPTGVALAADMGISISFLSWLSAAILPCALATLLIPYILYKTMSPEIKATPEAPRMAREALNKMGGFNAKEKMTVIALFVMILMWNAVSYWQISKFFVALSGLLLLLVGGVFSWSDFVSQIKSLSAFIWFAILFTMTSYLNIFGFSAFLGDALAGQINAFSWPIVYLILVLSYVFIHYFFVSQTAQLLALFSVFLQAGISSGVPGELLALMLLFATNFNSAMSPHASSANMLVVGSGYLTTKEIYLYGGQVTLLNTAIFLSVGTIWILMIG